MKEQRFLHSLCPHKGLKVLAMPGHWPQAFWGSRTRGALVGTWTVSLWALRAPDVVGFWRYQENHNMVAQITTGASFSTHPLHTCPLSLCLRWQCLLLCAQDESWASCVLELYHWAMSPAPTDKRHNQGKLLPEWQSQQVEGWFWLPFT